ncbi:MAG: GlsB/YeaQ/YmgE family stress response membrane protein [Myxococcaceae bacterium]|nr:GlsB/YeaQ/YmgE family stress response membrane protein [Myxococcaceae bacterium]
MSLIGFLLVGLIAGLIARFLMPGSQPMGMVATMGLGMGGSFIGGVLSSLLGSGRLMDLRPAGIIGATIGAFVLLLAFGLSRPRVTRS